MAFIFWLATIITSLMTTTARADKASWYADGRNASGKPVNNSSDMTAAHKTLPFGTRVRVTRRDTGRSVIVTIQDRGPYIPGRSIDLRRRPAEALGITKAGVVPVKIEIVD